MSKLEIPQLGIKTYKAGPTNWLFQGLSDTSIVLTVAMKGEDALTPNHVERTDWSYLEPGQVTFEAPDACYDMVVISNVLEKCSPEDQRLLIAEAARVTKNNGKVVAYHPACNDCEEVLELAEEYGLDTSSFVSRRMTNKAIARLKPHDAAFFLGKLVIPHKERLVTVMNNMGLPATLEHMWKVKEKFSIKRFHVGMAWHVLRS